jgi:hypothetical protein
MDGGVQSITGRVYPRSRRRPYAAAVADYVWWFLIVGLVIGGAVVAVISIDFSRRAEDVGMDELEAESTLIASQLRDAGRSIDAAIVAEVLRADRQYRRLPPPDRLVPADAAEHPAEGPAEGAANAAAPASAGRDADQESDEVGDGRRRSADEDLTPA